VPKVDEDDKKKKAPKKGQVEIEKVIRGRAWLSLEDFGKQGGVETEQRVYLQTVILEPPKVEEEVKKEAKKEVKKEPDPRYNTEEVFEPAKSYVYIKITLSNPITPLLPQEGVPKPSDLIQKKPPLLKYPIINKASDMYRLQLKIAIEALAKEFLKTNSWDKGSTLNQQMRENFIDELNKSGKYFVLKEKLKKAVVRVAKENYGKRLESLRGLTKDERDQCYSELYTYLIDNMHETIKELVDTKRQELHEEIVAKKCIAQKEENLIINKANQEDCITRYKRLFKEYYRAGDYKTAEGYMLEVVKLQERDLDTWFKYYKYSIKTGNYNKAEECLREALSIDLDNQELLLALGGLVASKGKLKEAAIYIDQVLSVDELNMAGNLLRAMVCEMQGKPGLASKFIEVAKRRKMRELELIHPVGALQSSGEIIENPRVLTEDESDSIFYHLVDFLLKVKQVDLCEKALNYLQNKENTKYLFIAAQCRFLNKDYEGSLRLLAALLECEPRTQRALKYKANIHFLRSEYAYAETAYIKCIMTKPPPKSLTIYKNLGLSFFMRGNWAEAKVSFFKCCEDVSTATAWKYLGVCYLRLGLFDDAENALSKANLMDNLNAEIWGYLGVLCLKHGKRLVQANQVLVEAFKLGLCDTSILKEITIAYSEAGEHEKAIDTLRRMSETHQENGEYWEMMGDELAGMGEAKQEIIENYMKALKFSTEENKPVVATKLRTIIESDPSLIKYYSEVLEKLNE
jgi:tetratricopeptide (TPR) repeat protein